MSTGSIYRVPNKELYMVPNKGLYGNLIKLFFTIKYIYCQN